MECSGVYLRSAKQYRDKRALFRAPFFRQNHFQLTQAQCINAPVFFAIAGSRRKAGDAAISVNSITFVFLCLAFSPMGGANVRYE